MTGGPDDSDRGGRPPCAAGPRRSPLRRRRGSSLACLFVLSLAVAGSAAADFRAGLTAYQRGDYASALREWRPLAEAGDPTAQLYLGLMYENGQGVPADLAEARRWFERAAATFPAGEDRSRALAGRDRVAQTIARAPVDPALVGQWQSAAPDPATGGTTERVWDVGANGQFAMTTIRKGRDAAVTGRSVERGQFRAKDGKWSYTLPSQSFEGAYRVIGRDAFETTGPLGIAQWTRVGSTASTAAGPRAPLPPPVGRVLHDTDFEKSRQWPEAALGACRTAYGDGGYVVAAAGPTDPCLLWSKADVWPERVRIDLQARLRKGDPGGAWGLMFGIADERGSHWYSLAVSADGKFRLSDPRALLIPWTEEPAIRRGLGAENTLTVDVQGRTLTVFINGKRVGTAPATGDTRGSAGFYVGRPGAELIVTRLRVAELPGAGPGGAPAAARLLLEDDFRSQRRWSEGASGQCRGAYRGGGYALEVAAATGTCERVQIDQFPARVRIELEARLQRGSETAAWGLLFGVSRDWTEGYSLAVAANGSYRLADTTRKLLQGWSPTPALKTGVGAVNTLAVEIDGRSVTLFANGQRLSSYQAPRDVAGVAGLYVGAPGAEVLFTRLRVTDLGGAAAPAPLVAPAAQPRVLLQTDFRANQAWPAAASCRTVHEEGGLSVEHVGPGAVCEQVLLDPGPLRGGLRVDLSVEFRRGDLGQLVGLIFGWTPDGRSYSVKITGHGWMKVNHWDGQGWQELLAFKTDPVLRTGYNAVNVLTVEVRGQSIHVFVNGKAMGVAQAPGPVSGRIGVNLNERGMKVLLTRLHAAEI